MPAASARAIASLKEQGYTCVDLHVHTSVSKDAFCSVDGLLRRAKELGIGLAILDHNEIAAAVEACKNKLGVPVIPGIEVKAFNGVDISVLFYKVEDLIAYYERCIVPRKERNSFVLDITVEEIVAGARAFPCVIIAPHPFAPRFIGLAGVIERGVVDPALLGQIDCIEIRNGAMTVKQNAHAAAWAVTHHKRIAGGSDAHIPWHFGRILSCLRVRPGEHPLDALKRKDAHVVHFPEWFRLAALVFALGQCKLLLRKNGWFLLRTHLSVCLSLKTRTATAVYHPAPAYSFVERP
ncbi:MAG: PHP domain-containing protein [Candidatus Peribacteraceae bacterium]|nr:PHP domain-containing protein [Candidatus Peribacteraceae bacterium]